MLAALEPRAQECGVEIVTVEVVGAKKAPTIRVYIDTEDGVSFDALSSAQAWINEIMDELDLPRSLTRSRYCRASTAPQDASSISPASAGEQAGVQTSKPIDGRSRWTARSQASRETSC